MKRFNVFLITLVSALFLFFVFAGPTNVFAATSPALGSASTYGAVPYTFADAIASSSGPMDRGSVTIPLFPETGSVQQPTSVAGVTVSMPMSKSEASSVFYRSLSLSQNGEDVIALQAALVQKGLLVMPVGAAKGYFGPLTRAAVEKYQEMNGLPVVGVFGPLTKAKLISELVNQ